MEVYIQWTRAIPFVNVDEIQQDLPFKCSKILFEMFKWFYKAIIQIKYFARAYLFHIEIKLVHL